MDRGRYQMLPSRWGKSICLFFVSCCLSDDVRAHLFTRDWHFGFETSRFRNFCQFFEGIGFGFGKFGIGKKVSVSVLENLVSEKKSRYRFRSKFWYRHSVLHSWIKPPLSDFQAMLHISIQPSFGGRVDWEHINLFWPDKDLLEPPNIGIEGW